MSAPETPPFYRADPGRAGTRVIRHGDQANLVVDVDKAGLGHFLVAPRGIGGLRKATRYAMDQAGWTHAWADFAEREPAHAKDYLRRLQPPPLPAWSTAPEVPLLTIATFPGREITEVVGLVTATAVMSRNFVSDWGSDIASAFGGNLEGVEHSITTCVEQVRERLYEQVEDLGADAVIGLTVSLETVADKAQAVLMSGTAVRLLPATAAAP